MFYGAGAFLAKIWADFFGSKFSHFWSVLEILSVVFNFLPSSLRFLYEDSDFQHESFQKIRGKKFERRQGRPCGGAISDFRRKIMILLKFREQQIWPTGAISGGFETPKSPGVLRCAQCSLFRRRHVQHSRVGVFIVALVGCELIELLDHAFNINMACRDGFLKPGLEVILL